MIIWTVWFNQFELKFKSIKSDLVNYVFFFSSRHSIWVGDPLRGGHWLSPHLELLHKVLYLRPSYRQFRGHGGPLQSREDGSVWCESEVRTVSIILMSSSQWSLFSVLTCSTDRDCQPTQHCDRKGHCLENLNAASLSSPTKYVSPISGLRSVFTLNTMNSGANLWIFVILIYICITAPGWTLVTPLVSAGDGRTRHLSVWSLSVTDDTGGWIHYHKICNEHWLKNLKILKTISYRCWCRS